MRTCLRAVVLVSLISACSDDAVVTPATSPEPTVAAPPTTSAAAAIPISLRLDRRVTDAATEGFEAFVEQTLTDPRGWQQAGFTMAFSQGGPFTVVLAEGDVVDNLCRPYDTYGKYSCQNGPVVALNADRWRHATPEWTGGLDEYRRMLVNHEVGHLLGLHHPAVQCPGVGQPAPLMAQQSTELNGCLPNPWPLGWEIVCAAQHAEPLAPGYEPDAVPLCGPDG